MDENAAPAAAVEACELMDRGQLALARRLLESADGSPSAAARAVLQVQLGDFDGASAGLSQVDGDSWAQTVAAYVQGCIACARSEVETALLHFDDAIHRARAAHNHRDLLRAQLRAARALLDRDGPADASAAVGRLADARSVLEQHESLSDFLLEHRLLLARARAATGDLDGAVKDAQMLLQDSRGMQRRDIEWRGLALLGRFEGMRGADFVARRHDQAAMEVLEALVVGLPRDARETFWADPDRRALRLRASVSTDRYVAAVQAERKDVSLQPKLERLLEIIKRLASEHDLDRLLERITDAAVELSGAERGFVLLPDDEGQLEPRLVRSADTAPDDPSVAFSRSIADAVWIDGEPIITVDARDDRRLSEYLSVHKLMLKSVACMPIRAGGKTVGVLYLEHRMRRGRFAEEDLNLLLAFADQAAIALLNARLYAALEQRKVELEKTNEELETAKREIERVLVARTSELEETRRELDQTRHDLRSRYRKRGIIGRSEPMRRVFAVIDRVSETNVPVVIQGESGTGKELAARAVHYLGPRSKQPFVALNCAAIPDALLESELFGHVRGAFTGADRDRRGVLSRASGGTLFLDEVGDMPGKMQVDLLRVLQDGKVRPIGGEEDEQVDVRIVSASNKSLQKLVETKQFREDLYYRLNVVEIKLPPLRERIGDLPLLCEHFLEHIAKQEGRSRKRISKDALARLQSHPMPGNVRQLEHVLLNACVMTEAEVIEADDLALGEVVAANELITQAVVEPVGAPASQTLEDFKASEKQRILAALEEHNWNRAKAARAMGIPRRTFYRRLKEHGIL